MSIFERFLSLWVGAAIGAGVGLGLLVPSGFEAISRLEIARVNVVVAVLIWLMIYPMMLKVQPSCLKDVGKKPSSSSRRPSWASCSRSCCCSASRPRRSSRAL